MLTTRIDTIRKLEKKEYVYDFQVPNHNTFVLSNGVVVSNSGKSTLAFHIAKRVANKMKAIKKEIGFPPSAYTYLPERDLLYTRDEVLNFFIKSKSIAIADEMVNVSFGRDFFEKSQKDLIKVMNMYRDKCNLLIACVPQFSVLDKQIKNLCKMRLTVIRRGCAVVQTPNKTIYSSSIWDESANEKIEREWITQKYNKNPRYHRLTTYRGLLTFPKLSFTAEELYQSIKDKKRNIIIEKEKLEQEEMTKKTDTFELLMERLENRGIKNVQILEGYAISMGLKLDYLQGKIRSRLKDTGKSTKLSDYYWESGKPEQQKEKEAIIGFLRSME